MKALTAGLFLSAGSGTAVAGHSVPRLNNRVEMFPSSLVAGMFSVRCAEFFEVESLAVREAPAVQL